MVSFWAVVGTVVLAASASASPAVELSKRTIGAVKVCTGTDYTGSCWYGQLPLDTCIDLNGYSHNTLSFLPDPDTRCFVMQERCNSNLPYVDLVVNDPECSNLSDLPWISNVRSYTCYKFDTTNATTIARLRRVKFIPHPQ